MARESTCPTFVGGGARKGAVGSSLRLIKSGSIYPTCYPTCMALRKTSVYLDDAHVKRLAQLARQEGRSQAEILRGAIESYQPAACRDRDFALAAGFERIDKVQRPISQIPDDELLQGFGR